MMPPRESVQMAEQVAQKAYVERHASESGLTPREMLLRWADDHRRDAERWESAAIDARRKEQACRADANRWYAC